MYIIYNSAPAADTQGFWWGRGGEDEPSQALPRSSPKGTSLAEPETVSLHLILLAIGVTACALSVIAARCHRPGCGTQRLLRCRLHPAGRCPNNSSLFPPLAAVVAVAPNERRPWHSARSHLQIAKSARHLNEMPGVAFMRLFTASCRTLSGRRGTPRRSRGAAGPAPPVPQRL